MGNTKQSAQQTASAGFPLASILTIIFVIAKIGGYINWSWLWVLSPLWISLGFVIGVFLLVLLIACITAVALKVLDR
jgi:hypothetical protein